MAIYMAWKLVRKGIWVLRAACQASDTESDSNERMELDRPCDLFYINSWQWRDGDNADIVWTDRGRHQGLEQTLLSMV